VVELSPTVWRTGPSWRTRMHGKPGHVCATPAAIPWELLIHTKGGVSRYDSAALACVDLQGLTDLLVTCLPSTAGARRYRKPLRLPGARFGLDARVQGAVLTVRRAPRSSTRLNALLAFPVSRESTTRGQQPWAARSRDCRLGSRIPGFNAINLDFLRGARKKQIRVILSGGQRSEESAFGCGSAGL
jgi:hypothetical protein